MARTESILSKQVSIPANNTYLLSGKHFMKKREHITIKNSGDTINNSPQPVSLDIGGVCELALTVDVMPVTETLLAGSSGPTRFLNRAGGIIHSLPAQANGLRLPPPGWVAGRRPKLPGSGWQPVILWRSHHQSVQSGSDFLL